MFYDERFYGTGDRTRALSRFALVVFTACFAATPAPAEVLIMQDLFIGPQGEYSTERERYHTFRIPGMLVTADGTILAFCEARRGDGSDPRRDENAPVDLVQRRSTDNGVTWGALEIIESGYVPGGGQVDFADPTPVLDAETGTVFLFYGRWPDLGETTVKPGQDPALDSGDHIVCFRSTTDNGHTWSGRRQVVYPNDPQETSDGLYWRQPEPGPGHGIQLKWQAEGTGRQGRLLVPARRSGSRTPDGPASINGFIYYSDDHGKTWHVGQTAPGPTTDEQEVVELTDGRVLMDARQGGEEGHAAFRRRHVSVDGGVSWGAGTSGDIAMTPVDASMVRYSAQRAGHDKDRILFSGPKGAGGLNRNNITVWTSYDEGATFTNGVQLRTGFAAYSVLQRLMDGTIGMLVETPQEATGNYSSITFYRFDLAELEGTN